MIYSKLLLSGLIVFSEVIFATDYYVDSVKGKDSNSGTSEKEAWQSLLKVNSMKYNPGDKILFCRGGIWTGELTITSSGNESQPIIYTAYGKGQNPVIQNPEVNRATAIQVNADWIVVENFLVREAHAAGINIDKGAEYNVIRNNEATKVGIGIAVRGSHNLV